MLAMPAQAITTTTVDVGVGETGQYTSQAIVNGNPAIAYHDAAHGNLMFARNSAADGAGTWTITTVASANVVGQYASLAIVNGNPAISYYAWTGGDLKYVRATDVNGTAWGTPVTADSTGDVGYYTSLVVVNGNPAISYYAASVGDLKYVRATDISGGSWGTPATLDSAGVVGLYTSLAIVNGNPAVSYYDSGNGDLKYLRATDASGGTWDTPVILDSAGTVGQYASLGIVNGNPAVSYHDVSNGDLRYLRAINPSGTAWDAPVTLQSAGTIGQYTALTIVDGTPAISYYDASNGDLQFLRATDASGTAWGTPVPLDSVGSVGQYTSLAIVNGNPAVSYYDVSNGDLKHVRATDISGGAWGAPATVDSVNGVVGLYTSLAIVNGNPAVSYYDSHKQYLKYVRASDAGGTAWGAPLSLYSVVRPPSLSSLTVVNGNPAVIYPGAVGLYYARATDVSGTAWGTPVQMDFPLQVGNVSLAIVNGYPAISYANALSGDLRYVRATDASGTAWGTPVALGDTSDNTSLAVVNGNPAIGYYGSGNLKYVRATDAIGGSWAPPVTVDSTAGAGMNASLAIVNGNPAISYFDLSNGDLKYVRATDTSGTAWGAPVTLDSAGTVGKFTSLTIVNGSPAISYHDSSNGDLKYIRATDASGTAWDAPVTMDSAGDVGQYTSLAVVNGNAAISYYDVGNNALKFATLGTPPTIITQPAPLAVTKEASAVFSVYATGTGTLTYQWKKGGTPIGGATGAALVINPVGYGDAGTYTVDVTDSNGTTTSASAGLSVNSPVGGDVDFGFFANSAVDGTVSSVALQPDGKVLIGGAFTMVNGTARSRIARLNADGSTDYSFANGLAGANNSVLSVALQPDGKVLIGGVFSTVNGTARGRIARLNADGTLDTGFGNGLAGANGTVLSVAFQPDGKVLIGGDFTAVNGTARGRIARLNSDGSLDTGFGNGLAGAVGGSLLCTVAQSDGKVLIGGAFTTVNGTAVGKMARLNSDGSLDTGFLNGLAGASGPVYSLAVHSDGKIVIGGFFALVNGTPRTRIARLNSDGTLDTGFGNGLAGANNLVYSVALQPDGKVLIGGDFTTVNGTARGRIARLNADGTLDAGFGNGLAGANNSVLSIAMQADGKVLVGGAFTTVNGTARGYVARLNADGSLDTGLQNGLAGVSGDIYSIALQPDGKVLIGGLFTAVNGTARGYVARLNADGTLDTGFGNGLAGADNTVNSVGLQPDGKVLIGGYFTTVNGTACGRIARLNADGSLDTGFGNGLTGANSQVMSIALQPDGKVLIGGLFTTVNGTARGYVARLNADGTLDTGFGNGLAGADTWVYSIALQPDGKVLIGGWFTTINGTACVRIARLNADGSLDTGFGNGLAGANNWISKLALQPDGKVLIGGAFTTMNGTARGHVARLNADGTLDTGFGNGLAGADNTVASVALQSDGKVLIGGNLATVNGTARGRIARLNADGSLDTGFGNGLAGANNWVNSIALQPDGKVLIGGQFTLVNGEFRNHFARMEGGADVSLSALTISVGTLSPAFSAGTTGYAASVPGVTTSVTVTPTSADPNATIQVRVNGGSYSAVSSGAASGAQALNVGANPIDVLVTGVDATTKLYTITVTRLPPPTIINQPQALAVTKGAQAVFSVYATGTGTLTYQWKKGGVPIGGATNTALILNPVQYSDAGTYTVDVTDSNGTTTSASAGLSVNSPVGGDVDFGFFTNSTVNGTVYSVAVQPDGKVLIGGGFTAVNGAVRGRVARLNADGSTDHSFGNGLAGATGSVDDMVLQSDGKVLIAGGFGTVNGVARGKIARLHADGSLDLSFGNGLAGANNSVDAVAVQTDGKVLMGGGFTMVNGIARGYIARLNADGSLDTGFGNGVAGADNWINSIAVQADGKVLISGSFTMVNGVARGRIARLNTDGTLDAGFGNGLAGADSSAVWSLALQPDGRVVIGGGFTAVNGTTRGRVARLNADGTLDTGFANGLPGANSYVYALAVQADGKVLIGGAFTAVNGTSRGSIARLNADGTLDTSFGNGLPGTNPSVVALAVQTDGKVLIGGGFTTVNGTACERMARLNSDGTLDTGFQNGLAGANNPVFSVAVQSDGKVLIGGGFTSVNGTTRSCIARLNSDGTLDAGFQNGLSGANFSVRSMVAQSDGKVLIGGDFTTVNGTARYKIARLNSDGTLDTGFQNGLSGANNLVLCLAVQSDGKVLIGGDFTVVNGTARGHLARLNSDGTLDSGFHNGLAGADQSVWAMALQSDGKIMIGGVFTAVNGTARGHIARLNTDGTVDTGFLNGLAGADINVYSLAVQNNGKVLIGGVFSAVNGTGRNSIARLNNDGALDTGFQNGLVGANNSVLSLAVQSDGKVLMAGFFTTVNGTARGRISRLNADGTLDTGFQNGMAGANSVVRSIAVQGDGLVVIGGDFTTVNGLPRDRVARLEASANTDLSALALSVGTLSPAFSAGTVSYSATVGTASVTVTPTSADPNATIQVRVNGGSYSAVLSGAASGALALNVGANPIDVLVTGVDATTRLYTVTVTRSGTAPSVRTVFRFM